MTSERASTAGRGHRLLPHTADVIIEAWGPDREACLEEAARALVAVFAEVPDEPPTTATPVRFDALGDDLLVEVLDEIVFLADALGLVVVSARLHRTEADGVAGHFDVVALDEVEVVGAVPKGVSRSGLALRRDERGWHARAVIDV